MTRRTRAAFLDKDGTLIEDVAYNVDRSKIRLMPEAPQALRLLMQEGFRLIVITNQSGVAKGYFPEEALRGVEEEVRALVSMAGAEIDGFYYCPHLPAEELGGNGRPCDCRKPSPGLFQRAAAEHGVDLRESWAIGDILADVEAGRRAGCRTVLVGASREESEYEPPDYVAMDLLQAARIVARESVGRSRSR
jgi:histidinol-phosphate phosphatase family protein